MIFRVALLLATLGCLSAHAQIVNPKKIKYGKFSDAELALEQYSLQPEAEAVVLFDEGKLRMDYDRTTGGFEMVMERHLRIKILQSSGTTYGDFSVLLENSATSSAKEDIGSVKGITVNVEDGTVVETKLTKESIYRERISERLDRFTVSFPQVRTGSIIDLKYTFTSDYLYNLPTWYFQRRIPTDYCHFSATIPDYFLYQLDMKGYASKSLTESVVGEIGNQSIVMGTSGGDRLDVNTRAYRWTAVEVPGLRAERFAPNVSNYLFRIDFELASVNFPGQLGTNYSVSWEDVVATYRDNADLRTYFKPRKEVEELVQSWGMDAMEEREKMIAVYERTKGRLDWNGTYRTLPNQAPKDLLNTSSGSSADLNSFLISTLRAAGLTAYPVLASTRENGYLSLTRPSLSQFNHQLVLVSFDEGQEYVLLDATHNAVPAALLPPADLNDRGRVITEEGSAWIELQAPASRKIAIQIKLQLEDGETYQGSLKYKASDYAAYFDRLEAQQEEGVGEMLTERFGYTLTDLEIQGFTDLYRDINVTSLFQPSERLIQAGELIYLPAVLFTSFPENPLKAEERILPIDFGTPQEYVYVMQVELPENIRVEELPEPIRFALPAGKGSYSIRYVEMNGNLQIIEKISLPVTVFPTTDYAALRNFFDLVIEQQQNMVILKIN